MSLYLIRKKFTKIRIELNTLLKKDYSLKTTFNKIILEKK